MNLNRVLFTPLVLALSLSIRILSPAAACPDIPAGSFPAAAREYESGRAVFFESRETFLSFVSWYLTQYRLEDVFAAGYRLEDGKSLLGENKFYDRTALEEKILTSFSPLSGNSDREKILHACSQIRERMTYDAEAGTLSLGQALDSGKGVCWHFAKVAHFLLSRAGIPSRILFGTLNGIPHMWLCCSTESGHVWADPQGGILEAEDRKGYDVLPYLSVPAVSADTPVSHD